MRGQNFYVEVTLGCPRSGSDNALQSNSDSMRNLAKNHVAESPTVGRGDQKGSRDQLPVYEKTFIYPAEAVLVPVLHTSFAKSSLKRYILLSVLQIIQVY
jgi:mediator of RNA polymerase II transcription subunit 13